MHKKLPAVGVISKRQRGAHRDSLEKTNYRIVIVCKINQMSTEMLCKMTLE